MSRRPEAQTDPPTTDRLRADIDSGKTHDKVGYRDPAATPLGSDDEAAGRPPTSLERQETAESRQTGPAPSRREPSAVWAYGFMIVGLVLVILAVAVVVLS